MNHLNALGTLPKTGYLAGQSVSSAIFDLFVDDGEGLVIYNDLDVFQRATDVDLEAAKASERTLDTVGYQSVGTHLDSHQLYLAVTKAYDIVRSCRDGDVNTVAYQNLHQSPGIRELACLLRGFDLNCTQAGVDLSTGELVWTQSFAEFVKTRQLLINNVQTPNHTAIRWFKKRHELPGCYGRDEESMELITILAYAKADPRNFQEKRHLRWRFGDKNAYLYQQFRHELAGYFDLAQDLKQGFHLLKPTQTPDADWVKLASQYPLRAIPQVFHAMRAPIKAAQRSRIHHIYSKGCCDNGTAPMTVVSLFMQSAPYIDHLQSPTDVDAIDRFLCLWPFLTQGFMDYPASVQLGFTRAWLAAYRRHGESFRHFSWRRATLGFADIASDCEQAFVCEAAHQIGIDEPLVDRHPLRVQIDGHFITELITRRQLLDEGQAMNHCVGGYAGLVYRAESRIFSIRQPQSDSASTVEYRCDRYGHWNVAQHFGPGNNEADVLAQSMVKEYLSDLVNSVVTVPVAVIINDAALALEEAYKVIAPVPAGVGGDNHYPVQYVRMNLIRKRMGDYSRKPAIGIAIRVLVAYVKRLSGLVRWR